MFSPKLIEEIHKEIIRSTGGSFGIRDENLLESSLKVPFQTFGKEDLYKTPIEKAAKLLETIIKNYPFVDGNKRVAYVLFRLFLEENGYVLTATEEEKYNLIMSIASHKISYKQIIEWTRKHSSKVQS
uniref:type II toxin-antitoxin system death-on-curing family toxin n=1 Tax=Persephonella sp. TaxID=2060922 RepID=UPI0026149E7A|nr:type II toxin-antitoxin system death-on-curing family toxin [Persephonella sp.]